jgi:hypothetical protein
VLSVIQLDGVFMDKGEMPHKALRRQADDQAKERIAEAYQLLSNGG